MLADGNPVMDSHPALRSSRNTLCRIMPLKPEISSGEVEHLDWEERSFCPLDCNTFTIVFSRYPGNARVSRESAKLQPKCELIDLDLCTERNQVQHPPLPTRRNRQSHRKPPPGRAPPCLYTVIPE